MQPDPLRTATVWDLIADEVDDSSTGTKPGLIFLTEAVPAVAGNGWVEWFDADGVRWLSLVEPERPQGKSPCDAAPPHSRFEPPESGREDQ